MSGARDDARPRVEPEDGVPMAAGLKLGLCAHCDAVHLIFIDDAGAPLMTGALQPADWDAMVALVAAERAEREAATGMPPVMGRA